MQTNNSRGYDYSLYQLLQFILSKYKLILGIPLLITIVTAIWTLTIPNTYMSDTTLSPTEESQGAGLSSALGGQLGGLASLAGISMGAESTDNVTIALAILKSRKFQANFVNKYQLKEELMAVESWDAETDELVFNLSIFDPDSQTWTRQPNNGRPSEPTDLEVHERMLELLVIETDQSTGLVTLKLEFYSPTLAQKWLALMVQEVNREMRAREITVAQENIEYLEKQVEAIDNIEMRSVFYQLIQEQTKNLMLAEVRSDFVFTTIDPPAVPEVKFAPQRALICLVSGFLSGFLIVAFITIVFLVKPRQ